MICQDSNVFLEMVVTMVFTSSMQSSQAQTALRRHLSLERSLLVMIVYV